MIEVSANGIEQAVGMLQGIPGGAQEALTVAINKGRAKLKLEISSGIVETYAISKNTLNANAKISTNIRKESNSMVGTISYSGAKIPLYDFSISQKSPNTGGNRKPVNAGQITMSTFTNAFVASMKSGHIGLYQIADPEEQRNKNERIGNAKYSKYGIGLEWKIEEVMGSSVAQMAEKVDVREKAEETAADVINSEIGNAITKVLDKYKG